MKTKLHLLLVVGVLLLGSVTASHALSPRQHAWAGQIERIDFTKQTMTLKPEKVGLASRSFVWNDSTRFRANGAAVGAERVTPGQRVRVFYRREVGRLVLREVTLESNAARSPCRGCYSAAQ